MMVSAIGTAAQCRSVLPRAHNGILIAFLTAAYLIYSATALVIHLQQHEYAGERSSLAAAISNTAYGAPLGKVYSGVLAQFLDFKAPLDQSFADAARHQIAPDKLLGNTSDGTGIGYVLVASLSMRLFGAHVSSTLLGMLLMMGISALAFLWRFQYRYAMVVVLTFTTLTIMCFTPLGLDPDYSAQLPIGGIRYFSLVAILPAIHLYLEIVETRAWEAFRVWRQLVPLIAQVVVLALAILTRNSGGSLIAAIAVVWLALVWKRRHDEFMRENLIKKAACFVVVTAAVIGIILVSFSNGYLRAGRFSETTWQRIFISLGANPEWPFGDLRQIYNCTAYIPEGFVSGIDDRNGHCAFLTYAISKNIPINIASSMVYGREYNAALRQAFFNVLWRYPGQTLKTFYYYKPLMIIQSLAELANLDLQPQSQKLVALLVASLINLFAFTLYSRFMPPRNAMLVLGATGVFAAFAMLPYIVAWSRPYTTSDLLFYCIFGAELSMLSAIAVVGPKWFPATSKLLSGLPGIART